MSQETGGKTAGATRTARLPLPAVAEPTVKPAAPARNGSNAAIRTARTMVTGAAYWGSSPKS